MKLKYIEILGRPRIGFYNCGYWGRLRLLGHFNATTFKKKVFKCLLFLLCLTGLVSIFLKKCLSLELTLSKIRERNNVQGLSAIVSWPTDPKRSRCYVSFFDKHFKPDSFCKICFDGINGQLLENEKKALEYLRDKSGKRFKVPEVLFFDKSASSYTSLITTLIPYEFKLYRQIENLYPEGIFKGIRSRVEDFKDCDIFNQFWWIEYEKRSSQALFFKENLEKAISKKKIFGLFPVHGDFGSENIFSNGQDFFLIDWERFHEAGPMLTDPLGFWLGRNHSIILDRPERSFKFFLENFVKDNHYSIEDSLLALSFFYGAEFNVSEAIVDNCPAKI